MAISTSFNAAILVNSISALDPAFNTAFRESINSASPGARIEFFDPIEAQTYPEPGQYDLIVLTGGATADASAKEIPWVLRMHDFLRTTAEKHPKQKLVAVCWGHEAIHIAFGGVIGPMAKFEVCYYLELRRLSL
jgi:GMP synthase-like glutamine amidotransferase